MDFAMNIVGLVFRGLFISISRMTLTLFLVDPMPSEIQMLKAFPDLVFGSPEWWHVLPIGIGSFCIYCVPFIAFVSKAVLQAPHLAANQPHRLVRYRFAFGSLRPDRWWVAIVLLTFEFSLSMVQVVARNVQDQLYSSIFVLIIFTVILGRLQPFKFKSNNRVDIGTKHALILLMTFATSTL